MTPLDKLMPINLKQLLIIKDICILKRVVFDEKTKIKLPWN